MAGEGTIRPAPLSHIDEKEHRRLIAIRANAIPYEEGEFTPELTFATPGDLSLSAYSVQAGKFWRVGPLVHYLLQLSVTPTFTTAASFLQVTGLPYAAVNDRISIGSCALSAAGITFPAGRTQVVTYIPAGEDIAYILAQGSAVGYGRLVAADVTSAVAMTIIMHGCYPFT